MSMTNIQAMLSGGHFSARSVLTEKRLQHSSVCYSCHTSLNR
jgi:hypothetical protein